MLFERPSESAPFFDDDGYEGDVRMCDARHVAFALFFDLVLAETFPHSTGRKEEEEEEAVAADTSSDNYEVVFEKPTKGSKMGKTHDDRPSFPPTAFVALEAVLAELAKSASFAADPFSSLGQSSVVAALANRVENGQTVFERYNSYYKCTYTKRISSVYLTYVLGALLNRAPLCWASFALAPPKSLDGDGAGL